MIRSCEQTSTISSAIWERSDLRVIVSLLGEYSTNMNPLLQHLCSQTNWFKRLRKMARAVSSSRIRFKESGHRIVSSFPFLFRVIMAI
jgi:hypothetical protein